LEHKELQRIKAKVGTSMGHAFIPSKNDLRDSTIDTLVNKIENHKIYDEAHRVLDKLREDIDEEQMAFKLISMLLDQQEIKGPNAIGIPADRIEAILARAAKRGGGNGRGRGRGRSGGNRGGGNRDRNRSGGGYRGNREGGSRDGSGYRGNGGSRNRSNSNRHRD
jgi:ATP-dependent RNA helicase DeaD